MAAEIDELEIQISAEARDAVANLEGIADRLEKLAAKVTSATPKLDKLAQATERLKKSAVTTTQAQNFERLAEALGKLPSNPAKVAALASSLKELSSVKVSGTLAKNLSSIAASLNGLGSGKAAAIREVADALGKISGTKISSTVASSITKLSTALGQMPEDAQAELKSLATALSSFKDVKVHSSVGSSFTKLATALRDMPIDAHQQIGNIATQIKKLEGLKISASIANNLAKIPKALKDFTDMDVSEVVAQFERLVPVLDVIAFNATMAASAFGRMPTPMRQVDQASLSTEQRMTSLNSKVSRVRSGLASFTRELQGALGFGTVFTAIQTITRGIGACVDNVNTYIENMNLFEASMGEYTKEAMEYANIVQDAMGIDAGQWARNQGVFQTLITGMGQTADKAAVMSQQLTQLGYDIASFYNISVDDAMLKIQSGVAGELEPLRRLGWDLSDAKMNAELAAMGIDDTTRSMTQAEKVALRYHLIMTQVTITHGDMARTIQSPANQLRVLQAQLDLAARAIGNLFIPALNALLPYVIGVVKAVRILAQELANFFGIDVNFEVDYSTLDTSGIASASDGFDDAADATENANKKAKEYKNTVMGFDELNKLNDESEAASDDEDGSGINLDLPLETYDFLEGLDSYVNDFSDQVAENVLGILKKVLPVATAVGAAIAGWKIASAVAPVFEKIRDIMKGTSKHALDVCDNLDKASRKKLPSGQLALPAGHSKSIFENLNKASLVRFASLPVTALRNCAMSAAAMLASLKASAGTKLNAMMSSASAPIAGVALGIAAVALQFEMLYKNSEAFRSGIANLPDVFQAVVDAIPSFDQIIEACENAIDSVKKWAGDALDAVAGFATGAWGKVKEFLAGFGIDVSPVEEFFENVGKAIEDGVGRVQEFFSPFTNAVGEAFGVIGGFCDELLGSFTSCFDVSIENDWLAVAGGVLLAIPTPFTQAAGAIMLAGEAVSLFLRGIGDCVTETDVLADCSDEVRERCGTAFESIYDLGQKLDEQDWGVEIVTQEDVDDVARCVEDIRQTIINGLDAKRNEELASIDAMAGIWTQEQIDEAKQRINDSYDQMASDVETGAARIVEIEQNAANEGRDLTAEEAEEVKRIRGEMQDYLIEASGATEEELSSIAEKLANNEEAAALNAAAEVIKSAKQTRDDTIAAAEEQYATQVELAKQMYEAGDINEAEYNDMVQKAEMHRDETIRAAEECYTGVYNEVESGLGDSARKIDLDTGQIKSNWDIFCEDVSSAWAGFCNDIGEWWDRTSSGISQAWNGFWDGLASVVSTVVYNIGVAVNNLGNGISNAFRSILNLGIGFANGLVDVIESAINGTVDLINMFQIDIPDNPITGAFTFGFNVSHATLRRIASVPSLPYYEYQSFATGGFPPLGQLFVAREAGPEMVGNLGGKSAVANNDQIVEGIEEGVFRAMMQALPIMNASNTNGDITLVLKIGEEEIARASERGKASLARRGMLKTQALIG